MEIMFVCHMITYELVDPSDEFENMTEDKLQHLRVQCFYYGAFLGIVTLGLCLISTNFALTIVEVLIYGSINVQQIFSNPYFDRIRFHYIRVFVMLIMICTSCVYSILRNSKNSFHSNKKVVRLLKEQKVMQDELPDGAMIFKKQAQGVVSIDNKRQLEDVKINYLNSTFKTMFK